METLKKSDQNEVVVSIFVENSCLFIIYHYYSIFNGVTPISKRKFHLYCYKNYHFLFLE